MASPPPTPASWQPDRHPVHRALQLLDVLAEAVIRTQAGGDALDPLQQLIAPDPVARGRVADGLDAGVLAYTNERAGGRAIDPVPLATLVGRVLTPGKPAATVPHQLTDLRSRLVRLLAGLGEHVADGVLYRTRLDADELVAALPAPWRPATATDGFDPDGTTVRYRSRAVVGSGVPYRVARYMWDRPSAPFQAVIEFVNENRSEGAPTDGTVRSWARRANELLAPLDLPWALTTDGKNRVLKKAAVSATPAVPALTATDRVIRRTQL